MAFIVRPGVFESIRNRKENARQFDTQQTVNQVNQSVKLGLTQIKNIADTLRAKNMDPAGPEGQKLIAPLAAQILETTSVLEELGVEGGMNSEMLTGIIAGAVQGQTADEALAQKVQATEQLSAAQARGTAAGTPPEPVTSTRVVRGDDPIGASLGLQPGEAAKAVFTLAEDGTIAKVDLASEFGSSPVAEVNVDIPKAQEAGEVERAKLQSRRDDRVLTDAEEKAGTARRSNETLAFIRRTLPEVDTGSLAQLRLATGRLVESFGLNPQLLGIDINEISSGEALGAAMAAVAQTRAEALSGSMSDNDLKFIQQQAPRLGNTTQGNVLIIDYLEAINNRAIQRQQMAEAWFDEKGTMRGFSASWQEYVEQNPLFGNQHDVVNAALESAALAPPPPPAGMPAGSVMIGETRAGLPIYQTPDGRNLVVE